MAEKQAFQASRWRAQFVSVDVRTLGERAALLPRSIGFTELAPMCRKDQKESDDGEQDAGDRRPVEVLRLSEGFQGREPNPCDQSQHERDLGQASPLLMRKPPAGIPSGRETGVLSASALHQLVAGVARRAWAGVSESPPGRCLFPDGTSYDIFR
jgi:hypothetical protein